MSRHRVILVENLGKQYRIGQREQYKTLRETLINSFYAPARGVLSQLRRSINHQQYLQSDNHIWALRDVSFHVDEGEALGIIGRNGSGKSTLLKIISRITEPTEGRVEMHGRVGTLMEVGTGFHPELTGRENIYFSGAILGMRKAEIDRKFDEIVAFAEVPKFIDTPVKHYSSGMYMRLAFGVAAHLESEVLLVDEVLAVGDIAFQKKCLGKMGDVAKQGRTVLFISHNLASLANLCQRALLLVEGRKWNEGPATSIIAEYISMGSQSKGECVWQDIHQAPGNANVRLHSIRIVSANKSTADVDIKDEFHVQVEFWNLKPSAQLSVAVHLIDKMGVPVLATANMPSANLVIDKWYGREYPVGLYRSVCIFPGNFLNEGRYSINAFVLADVTRIEASSHEAVSFMIHDTGLMRAEYDGEWIGVVRPKLAWRTEFLEPLDG